MFTYSDIMQPMKMISNRISFGGLAYVIVDIRY
jgi:hypothetical protein